MKIRMTDVLATTTEMILQAKSRGYELVMTNGKRTPQTCPKCNTLDAVCRFKKHNSFVFACKCGYRASK